MRIKASERIASLCKVEVYMDGRKVEMCQEADDSAGWAIVADRNEDGSIKVDRAKNEVVTRNLYGSIRFQLPQAAEFWPEGRKWLSGRRPQ